MFALRSDLALQDMTNLELALLLKELGWEWRRFPSKTKDRIPLQHHISDGEKVWFTGGAALHRFLSSLLARRPEIASTVWDDCDTALPQETSNKLRVVFERQSYL